MCARARVSTLLTQVFLHPLQIRSLAWNVDDSKLISAGTDGAVYEWNLSTGKRETECVLKSCSYNSVTVSPDAKIIFAVGSDQTLKEIADSVVSPPSLALAAPQCCRRQASGLLIGSMHRTGLLCGIGPPARDRPSCTGQRPLCSLLGQPSHSLILLNGSNCGPCSPFCLLSVTSYLPHTHGDQQHL